MGVLVTVFVSPQMLKIPKIVPFSYRYHVFAVFWSIGVLYPIIRTTKPYELGFRFDNFKESLLIVLTCTFVGVGMVYLLKSTIQFSLNTSYRPLGGDWRLIQLYTLLFAPIQVFIYRSLLMQVLSKINDRKFVFVGVSTLTYWSFHLIYRNDFLIYSTIISGLIWSYMLSSTKLLGTGFVAFH